jgi:hypothetical protein
LDRGTFAAIVGFVWQVQHAEMMWRQKMKTILGLIAVVMLSVACGPSYIKGTEILDTPENQEILDLVENYRMAIEGRDATMLAQVVSRSYFENASTTNITDDDYGYEQLLKEVLPVLRDNIKKVIYKVTVDEIKARGKQARVFVSFELTCQYVEGGVEGWSTAKDRNRIDLVVEDGRWKISSGL